MNMQSVSRSTLTNGLELIKVDLPYLQTVTTLLAFGCGSRYETPSTSGLAHFLEHLVFKGTQSLPTAKSLAEATESVGGLSNAWTAQDHTAYWNVIPLSRWQMGLKVVCELGFKPLLLPEEVERERSVILEEIHRTQDEPSQVVDELADQLLFADHPLGQPIIGTEHNIRSLAASQFVDFHASYYQSSNARLVVIGNLGGKPIEKELERLVPAAKEGAQRKPKQFVGTSQAGAALHSKDTDQAHFVLAASSDRLSHQASERYVAAVLNAVLGLGMSSRLFQRIREEQGLAYSIYSHLSLYHDAGAFQVAGGLTTTKIIPALQSIAHELTLLRQDLIQGEELSKAKALLAGIFDLQSDRPIDIARRLAIMPMLGDPDDWTTAKAAINAVTAPQLRQLAQFLLDPQQLILAVVGPYQESGQFEELIRSF